MLRLLSGLLLSLSIASSVLAVEIEWTPVPAEVPENACDAQGQGCFGAIEYDYSIGTYEVTNAEYAEFLNAKAASDPLALYNTQMGVAPGGIARPAPSATPQSLAEKACR